MKQWQLGWLGIVALAVVPFACIVEEDDDDDEVEQVCSPGATQLCFGPGACEGAQVCNDDGMAFGECDCGSGGSSPVGGAGGTAQGGAAQGGEAQGGASVGGAAAGGEAQGGQMAGGGGTGGAAGGAGGASG
jgi:hypothetical protein